MTVGAARGIMIARGGVLYERSGTGGYDHYALAAAADGSVVLASSNERARRHHLTWLIVDGRGRLVVRGRYASEGRVVGQIVAEGRGVSRAVFQGRDVAWDIVGTHWSSFRPASHRDLGEVF